MKTTLHKASTPTPNEPGRADGQFVNGPKLLEILFPQPSRPTLRWLRDQQKARRIPFVKIGRLVFFCPDQVRRVWENRAV